MECVECMIIDIANMEHITYRKRKILECSVDGCSEIYEAKGYCIKHYHRYILHGDPLYERIVNKNLYCIVEGCDKNRFCKEYCQAHYSRWLKNGDPLNYREHSTRIPGTYADEYGYIYELKPNHPNSNKDGWVRQHIRVMSEYLSRPIMKGETIHHKNGIRSDNRIENLELWSKQHPAGQRVKDVIRFCIEYLTNYSKDISLWPEENLRLLEVLNE